MKFIQVLRNDEYFIIPTSRIKSICLSHDKGSIIINTVENVDFYLPVDEVEGKDFNLDYKSSFKRLLSVLNTNNNQQYTSKKTIKPIDIDSKYKGVHFAKALNKWVAQTRVNKKKIYIGSFDTALEASEAYNEFMNEVSNAN